MIYCRGANAASLFNIAAITAPPGPLDNPPADHFVPLVKDSTLPRGDAFCLFVEAYSNRTRRAPNRTRCPTPCKRRAAAGRTTLIRV